jgi:hypothetical protein
MVRNTEEAIRMLSSNVLDLPAPHDCLGVEFDDSELARELGLVGGDLEKDLVRRRHDLIFAAHQRGWSTYKIAGAAKVSQPSVCQVLARKARAGVAAGIEGGAA